MLTQVTKCFTEMDKELKGKELHLSELSKDDTAIVVVDMVNGFVHKGALASPRIVGIINNIAELLKKTTEYKKIFFLDNHEENSIEFKTYAKHCLKNSLEAELIPELKNASLLEGNTKMIKKNSTNGFHAEEFKFWLQDNEDQINNYIVVGCEADICVSHFATTLKTYFNEKNLDKRIIVPIDGVETFDFGTHDGDILKLIALWEMKSNGIEIVENIQ